MKYFKLSKLIILLLLCLVFTLCFCSNISVNADNEFNDIQNEEYSDDEVVEEIKNNEIRNIIIGVSIIVGVNAIWFIIRIFTPKQKSYISEKAQEDVSYVHMMKKASERNMAAAKLDISI